MDTPCQPYEVRVDAEGRLFTLTGALIVIPGLEPAAILQGIADGQAGRVKTLEEIRARHRGAIPATEVSGEAHSARVRLEGETRAGHASLSVSALQDGHRELDGGGASVSGANGEGVR